MGGMMGGSDDCKCDQLASFFLTCYGADYGGMGGMMGGSMGGMMGGMGSGDDCKCASCKCLPT
jgi:Eukaryotic metallothionein